MRLPNIRVVALKPLRCVYNTSFLYNSVDINHTTNIMYLFGQIWWGLKFSYYGPIIFFIFAHKNDLLLS